ncbi:outer membrane beta-barrel protein [Pontibacter roseus]|uniref:outer membrane beta-barrel protein n=1 Tax=Pontibacter roseus TaxID=336989 RepID=UPI0003820C16|nr:outer membrane beta-barrel protein [Pontibacter roseus]
MKQTLLAASLVLSALFLALDSSAQAFRPGFVVRTEGDTLHGFVKYREGQSKHSSCLFKTDNEADAMEYSANAIAAYGIAGDAPYVSREVRDTTGAAEKKFVESLVLGRLSLYQHLRALYLQKDGGELKLLQITTDDTGVPSSTGDIKTVTTSTQHLILMNSLTYDCPVPEQLMLKLQKKLNAPDVIAVVRAYNNCAEPENNVTFKEDKPWLSIGKGITIGVSSTSLKFMHTPELSAASFTSSQNLVVGALFNFSSPKKSERLSVQFEPLFSTEKHTGHAVKENFSYTRTSSHTVEVKRLLLPILVQYNMFTTKTLSPYFGAGLSSGYGLSSSIVSEHEIKYTSKDLQRTETSKSEIGHKVYFSPTAAVGTKIRISQRQEAMLQLRYEHGRYIQDGPSVSGDRNGYLSEDNKVLYLTASYIIK